MQSASTLICLCLLLAVASYPVFAAAAVVENARAEEEDEAISRLASELSDMSDDVVPDVFEMESLSVPNEAEEDEDVLVPARPRRRRRRSTRRRRYRRGYIIKPLRY
ncbi:unnamed protein product [Hydatigera taeniaeformis]|uniref:Uncharacterized protein n=1 Tax=Hydatigena taeniaeformis TaxID=6205 RepID=A0A0R3XAE8_HYDTA|nr:unnamed protein product [Hydatigera taeniaeformis]